ncbi:MAG: aminotransferase class IV [Eubacteriales bacterium]|nr:aminotransferase class IV [Eubacteriales bacterium]
MAYPMIDGLIGNHVSIDGQLLDPQCFEARFCFEPIDDLMYYEVIRIEQQIPLFWEDHFQRLMRSIDGRFSVSEKLYSDSLALIQANGLNQVNLRLVLTAHHTIIHEIPSYYPSNAQMQRGVPTGILHWERHDPNIKIINSDYKTAVASRFATGGPFGPPFELLLVDHEGLFTEGSRSNLFFIRGNMVYTAPDHCILKGITRHYVANAIETAGAQLVIRQITLEDLKNGEIDAAFLSGSPIDLLPIASIEALKIPSAANQLFIQINNAYQKIVTSYLENH